MQKDLISVIIPCYNASNYLEDLFLSLKNQVYKNIEVIFVDDGSTDDTLKKLIAFSKENIFPTKILKQKNLGPSAARNKGISASNGEFIYFGDADDVYLPNLLAHLKHLLDESKADFSCCKAKRVKNGYSYHCKASKAPKLTYKTINGKDNIIATLLSTRHLGFSIYNKLFRLSILKKCKNFPNVWPVDIYFGEDLYFETIYCKQCSKVVYSNKIMYFYRMSANSLVRSKFNEKKMTVFKIDSIFKQLNPKKYPKTFIYYKTFICYTCMVFLLEIAKTNFNNMQKINWLYSNFRKNIKYCSKGKMTPWYRKYFMKLTIPLVKSAKNKKSR